MNSNSQASQNACSSMCDEIGKLVRALENLSGKVSSDGHFVTVLGCTYLLSTVHGSSVLGPLGSASFHQQQKIKQLLDLSSFVTSSYSTGTYLESLKTDVKVPLVRNQQKKLRKNT